jgi:cytochrome c biogenesis protein CcmG, thiol:disulfide interchange protein DsbE
MQQAAQGTQRDWRARTRHSRVGTLIVMGVTAAIIFGVAYMVNRPHEGGSSLTAVTLSGPAAGKPPVVGKLAPDFAARTVDGAKTQLSAYRGKPVWLTFGASWCQPCRSENPDIQATYAKMRAKGVVVLGVFISEDAGTVRDYASRVGLTYTKVADPGTDIASAYRILGIPSHFFIDRSGVLRVMKIGTLDTAAMEAALAQISR